MIQTGQSSKGYTKAKTITAIKGSAGIITTIANRLGCTWNTAKSLTDRWPETIEAMKDERESVLDMCEGTLFKAVKEGDTGSAKWLLSTAGKDRGYVERQEVTGKDGAPALALTVSFVDPDEKPARKPTAAPKKTAPTPKKTNARNKNK